MKASNLIDRIVDRVLSDEAQSTLAHEPLGRHLVVLDKGWIFAGDLSGSPSAGWSLSKVSNVRTWSKDGFGGLTKSADDATLDPCNDIQFEDRAVIFRVPISW